jgi:hypothetical protein
MRFVYIVAGLFLTANGLFVGLRLYETHATFTLAAVGPALLAAVALGALLIIKNVRPAPPEALPDLGEEEPPEEPHEES